MAPSPPRAAMREGASYVPKVGRRAVEEFSGQWPSLAEKAAAGIKSLFKMTDSGFNAMKANADSVVVCAVSDPTSTDCPLVFLSKGFEDMTCYRNDFALGRNCRFLQPNTGDVNKTLNGEELLRMREFCTRRSPKPGEKIINILLNEKRTGERFWNFLHMEHVQVHGNPYILGVQTVMDMPMPQILKDHWTSQAMLEEDSSGFYQFLGELRRFLDQLRLQMRGQCVKNMVQAASDTGESILRFMKRNCDDFEGDHHVPLLGSNEAWHFQLDVTWKVVLSHVKSLLVEIWGVSEFNDEEVACAVSDPRGQDCPLVYVSSKFESLTGYTRDWTLGRNCRFLQPNDHKRNLNFNEEDKLRMREFCTTPQPEETRIINLLVNENRQGYPFWNLLVMSYVWIDGHPYIFGVQTTIDIEVGRLTEILTMERDGVLELTRLRQLLRAKESNLQKGGLKSIAEQVVREWASTFPAYMELPRFRLTGSGRNAVDVPLAGVVLDMGQPSLSQHFQASLEEGVRHFCLVSRDEECELDPRYVAKVGDLITLRFAELLNNLKLKYLHYLASGTTFTLVTKPQYVTAFKSLSKALAVSGFAFHCWFLDVRAISADKPMPAWVEDHLNEQWKVMSDVRNNGDVRALGLYGPIGSIMQVMHSLRIRRNDTNISAFAVDDYPAKETDASRLLKFRQLYLDCGSPPLVTYNLYGKDNCLLQNVLLRDHAQRLGMDVCTMLLKWAEAKGYGALVPRIKEEDLTVRDTNAGLPIYHRGFTCAYARALDARDCVQDIEAAFHDVVSCRRTSIWSVMGGEAPRSSYRPLSDASATICEKEKIRPKRLSMPTAIAGVLPTLPFVRAKTKQTVTERDHPVDPAISGRVRRWSTGCTTRPLPDVSAFTSMIPVPPQVPRREAVAMESPAFDGEQSFSSSDKDEVESRAASKASTFSTRLPSKVTTAEELRLESHESTPSNIHRRTSSKKSTSSRQHRAPSKEVDHRCASKESTSTTTTRRTRTDTEESVAMALQEENNALRKKLQQALEGEQVARVRLKKQSHRADAIEARYDRVVSTLKAQVDTFRPRFRGRGDSQEPSTCREQVVPLPSLASGRT